MREQEEVPKVMSAVAGVGYGFQTTITPRNSGDSGESNPPPPPPDDGDEGEPPPSPPAS